jgi:hypothetical protein
MEPITTLSAAIATMIVQKALEKAGEKLGEQVAQQSAKLLATLKIKSPQTASAIESALEQPLNYRQTIIEVEALVQEDPEFAKAVRELAAVASKEADIRLSAPIRELVGSIKEQDLSTQNLGRLADKIGVVSQGGLVSIQSLNFENSIFDLPISNTPLKWLEKEGYENYQFQWEVFIKFSGKNFRASKIFRSLSLLAESLESISGVSVEIESQGIGSIWFKLRVFILNLIQKEEVKEVLEKTRDAVVAEQLDKRIKGVEKLEEDTLKTKAERLALERQSENVPDAEEARKLRGLEIQRKELEIREKIADIKRKEIENQQKELELYEKLAYMMKEGLLTSAPVEIQINGIPFLSYENREIVPGRDMNMIDEKGVRKPDGEAS